MAEPALDVTVLWGRDVLGSRQLGDGDEAAVGDGPDALAPLPLEGADRIVFASVAGRRRWCHLPVGVRGFKIRWDGIRELVFGPRDVEVGAGEEVRIPLGAFTLVAAAGDKTALDAGASRRRRFPHAPTLIGAVAAVALVHVALLTFGSAVRPPPERGTLAVETAAEVRTLLVAAERREAAGDEGDGFGPDPGSDLLDGFKEHAPEAPPAAAEAVGSGLTPPGAGAEGLMCVGPAPAAAAEVAAAPAPAPEGSGVGYAGPAAGVGALLGLGLLGLCRRRILGRSPLRSGRRDRTRRPR